MRINLLTPFAEKDAAKALGARWDAKTKNWYVVDVADLTPFLRWMPPVAAPSQDCASGTAPAQAKSAAQVPHCGCHVLPWEDCVHTVQR